MLFYFSWPGHMPGHMPVAMANREKISQFRAATKTDLPTAQSLLAGECNGTVIKTHQAHVFKNCNLREIVIKRYVWPILF